MTVSQWLKKASRLAMTVWQWLKKTSRLAMTVSQWLKKTSRLAMTVSQWLNKPSRLAMTVSQWLKKTSRLAMTVSHWLKKTSRLAMTVSQWLKKTSRLAMTVSQGVKVRGGWAMACKLNLFVLESCLALQYILQWQNSHPNGRVPLCLCSMHDPAHVFLTTHTCLWPRTRVSDKCLCTRVSDHAWPRTRVYDYAHTCLRQVSLHTCFWPRMTTHDTAHTRNTAAHPTLSSSVVVSVTTAFQFHFALFTRPYSCKCSRPNWRSRYILFDVSWMFSSYSCRCSRPTRRSSHVHF